VVAPKLLASARGLASLRWRATDGSGADAAWSEPAFWMLPGGIPDLLARRVLPIRAASAAAGAARAQAQR